MMRIILAAVAGCIATGAAAERPDNRFYARGGAFFSNIDSAVRIDSNRRALGTSLDIENDLGLGATKTLPFARVGWRFADAWRIELEYFSLSRTRAKALDRSITVGDTVYPVNARIESGLSTNVYRLAFGYSFVRNPGLELGASLGAHLTDFAVFFDGSGSIGGVGGSSAARREARNQLVPLPTLGLYGVVPIDDTFAIVGRADYFTLKVGDYKGSLVDTSIGITAMLNDNFGIGADMRYVNYGLRATARDFTGRVDYNFYGPFVYATVGF